jgi:16S rRNA (guanine527-N7)-methyltransferase
MRPELRELLSLEAQKLTARLGQKELELFDRYLTLIQEYNKKLNLTGISDESGIVVKHFIDSLAGAGFVKDRWFVIDVGSGMGCPGLALKIVKPGLKIILLESNQKKCAFINQVIRSLKLANARAMAHRAEEKTFAASMENQIDAIFARAVGRLDLLSALGKPYLKNNGRLIAYKGPDAQKEFDEHKVAVEKNHFKFDKIFNYELPLQNGPRALVILKKI